jgi:hypothetical protein
MHNSADYSVILNEVKDLTIEFYIIHQPRRDHFAQCEIPRMRSG